MRVDKNQKDKHGGQVGKQNQKKECGRDRDFVCVCVQRHTHTHTHTQYRFNAVLVLQACWLVLWNRLENGENSHSANQRVLSPGVPELGSEGV